MGDVAKAIGMFFHLRPFLSLMLVGAVILFVKLWKTKSKTTQYTIKDFWKYGDDLILTGMALVLFLMGLIGFIWRSL